MTLNEKEILDYIDEINLLLEKAYVPYSKFPVAALLIDNNGKKHKGVNVENASFGLTLVLNVMRLQQRLLKIWRK